MQFSGELSKAPPSIQTQFDHQIDDIWAHKTEGESKKNRRTGYLVKWKDLNSFEPSCEKETTLCQFEKEIKEYRGKTLVPRCCMDGADGSVLLGRIDAQVGLMVHGRPRSACLNHTWVIGVVYGPLVHHWCWLVHGAACWCVAWHAGWCWFVLDGPVHGLVRGPWCRRFCWC